MVCQKSSYFTKQTLKKSQRQKMWIQTKADHRAEKERADDQTGHRHHITPSSKTLISLTRLSSCLRLLPPPHLEGEYLNVED